MKPISAGRCVETSALFLFLVGLLLVGSFASSVASPKFTTYYLDPDGDDTANGQSPSEAWRTLVHAFTVLDEGDELRVFGGEYHDDVWVGTAITENDGTALNPITVHAYGSRTPIFVGPGSGPNPVNTDQPCMRIVNCHWIIDGLTLTSFGVGITLYADGDDVLIQNCTFQSFFVPETINTSLGIYMGSHTPGDPCERAVVQNCYFSSIPNVEGSGEGIYLHGYTAGSVEDAQLLNNYITDCNEAIDIKEGTINCLVRGNHIQGCRNRGIYYGSNGVMEKNLVEDCLDGSSAIILISGALCRNNIARNNGGRGLVVDGAQNGCSNYIFNNLIYNNAGGGIRFWQGASCDNNTLVNNISAFNGVFQIEDATLGTGNLFDHNCWFGPEDTSYLDGPHTIREDPLFIDGDFHVDPTSPCVNAGDHLGSLVPDDYDGVTRPQGADYDIGAYEVVEPVQVAGPAEPWATTGEELATGTTLHGAIPNPFNPSTTISFELGSEGPVELVVLNVQGRVVRILESGSMSAGPHDFRWDGRDDGGRPLSSGVYFARFRTSGGVFNHKMLLLK